MNTNTWRITGQETEEAAVASMVEPAPDRPDDEAAKHRHYVAVPLVLTLVVLSLFSTARGGEKDASVAAHNVLFRGGEEFMLPGGTAGKALERGAVFSLHETGSQLLAGGSLLSSRGVVNVRADNRMISGVAGAFALSLSEKKVLSITAVSTPVLVTEPCGSLLVPVGYQWKAKDGALAPFAGDVHAWNASRAVEPLPLSYLEEQRRLLAAFEVSDVLPPSVERRPAFGPPSDSDAQALQRNVFGYVRSLVERGDAQALHDTLMDPAFADVLTHAPLAASAVADLLMLSSNRTMRLELLPFAASDRGFWLLASLHPALQPAPWLTLPPADTGREDALLRLFALPPADVQDHAFPPETVERWRVEAASFLDAEKDPLPVLRELLTELLPLFRQWNGQQYVERSARWAEAVETLVQPYDDGLTADVRSLVQKLRYINDDAQAPVTVQSSVFLSSAAQSSHRSSALAHTFTPDQIKAMTEAALRQAGALLTVQTAITPEGDHQAVVKSIVFSTASKDVLYGLRYDVETGMVSEAHSDGKSYPYALSLEKFAAWAKGR